MSCPSLGRRLREAASFCRSPGETSNLISVSIPIVISQASSHRPHARQVGCFSTEGHPAVHHGAVELFERKPDCGQVAFLDRTVLETVERLAQHFVGLAL